MTDDRPPSSSGKYTSQPVGALGGYPSGYKVLPREQRRKARRLLYKHTLASCGVVTRPPDDLAETIETDPEFYSDLWCRGCNKYFQPGEFAWLADGQKVGTA